MANLIYRSTSADPARGASSVKNLPLTNAEVDGNFKEIDLDLVLKATIDAPTFTGIPAAPTAAAGTDTTQLATTAFVNTEIANDAPTKTGGGASGTWGINVTGTSANIAGAGIVAVANGGTGVATLTGIVKGAGTGAFSAAAAGTDYVEPNTATTYSVAQTFAASGVRLKGSSTGYTVFTSANASATNYTITFPASTSTLLSTATAVTVAQGGTGITASGANGNILTSNGSAWVSSAPASSGATITNDTSTNTTQYLGMSRITTGAWTAAYVASTSLYFNPSTGTLNSTSFNSLSDQNLKENILQPVNALGTVNLLNGVEFTWKDSGKKSAGVIAQHLEEILPWLVETNDEGTKSVNYAGLTGYLIESIKQLTARIEVLENK